MKKILVILLSVLSISCSALAEMDRDDFYEKNSKQLDIVLEEVSKNLSSPSDGTEVWFPLFMKTKVSLGISSLIHTPDGLLIKTGESKISFIREKSEEIFFVGEGLSLLEVYSDIFTMNMNEILKKYATEKISKYGILDFKIALSIPGYEEKGYFQSDEFLVYFLIGKETSEAFILNKNFPGDAIRIGAQGLDPKKFKHLLTNISNIN